MLRHFPSVGVAKEVAPIDDNEATCDTGAVMSTALPAIERVVIDVHAALRIVKHARDAAPRSVFGKLTGIQIGTTAEVSGAVPYVQTPSFGTQLTDEEREERDATEDAATFERFAAAGFDTFAVGRYACCSHGLHLTARQLSNLCDSIHNGEPALLIAYDPLRSSMGKPWLKALIPTAEFAETLKADKDPDAPGPKTLSITESGVLREVPIEIYASTLQGAVLRGLAAKPRNVVNEVVQHSAVGRYTDRALHSLVENMDRLRSDVNARVYRSGHEEGGGVALRQETHVLVQQLREQSGHINAVAAGVSLNLDFARHMAQAEE